MVNYIKKISPGLAALGVGAFAGAVAMALGSVLYTGEGYGSDREPPEQIYFF